jgi:hypothetical protein
VRQARVAFTTTERDVFPEGLAYDPARDVFYLSSLYRRKIIEVRRDGSMSDFVPTERYALLPVLGIRVSPIDSTVWAASWSEATDTSELLHFDGHGLLLGRFSIRDGQPHGFNDLVILRSGDIAVTDSAANMVYRLQPHDATFRAFKASRPLFAPNGITVDADEEGLFVADDLGLLWIGLSQPGSYEVVPGPGTTLAGIDGLYWRDGTLVAVQNGIGSPRIMQFVLSPDSTRVTDSTVLETRTSMTITPTTGAIVGDQFFFVSNSQIDNMDSDEVVDRRKLSPAAIAELRLPAVRQSEHATPGRR